MPGELAKLATSEQIVMVERAKPLIARLARESGIVSPTADDPTALDLLKQLLDAATKQPEPPVLVQPARAFASLPCNEAQAVRIGVLRSDFTKLYDTVIASCKPGRYLSLGNTALEEACMWFVKSVTHEPLP